MKKIFIDCGAWNGVSSEFFYHHHPEGKDFFYHLFECHPNMINKLSNIDIPKDKLKIHSDAIWDKDTTKKFYVGKNKNCRGNSFYKNKITGNLIKEKPYKVHCINFSQFLCDMVIFDKVDFIACKMNIEGSEYPVINHLIETGAIKYIDKLYISWHWKKIRMKYEDHLTYFNALKETGIKFYDWDLKENRGNTNLKQNIEYFKSTLKE